MIVDAVEPFSRVVTTNEIDEFMKQPFESVNQLAVLVLDDYGSNKNRNWLPIINKLVTWSDRIEGRHCSIIIADNHSLPKSYLRDKRIQIKREW